MRKLGVSHELRRQGADGTSKILIGGSAFNLLEQ